MRTILQRNISCPKNERLSRRCWLTRGKVGIVFGKRNAVLGILHRDQSVFVTRVTKGTSLHSCFALCLNFVRCALMQRLVVEQRHYPVTGQSSSVLHWAARTI